MTSTVTCSSSTSWERNPAGRDACQQYAALLAPCDAQAVVAPVQGNSSVAYLPTQATASCACNIVAYNLQAGCLYCQTDPIIAATIDPFKNATWLSLGQWQNNCTALNQTPTTAWIVSEVISANPSIRSSVAQWALMQNPVGSGTWDPMIASGIASNPTPTSTTSYHYSTPTYTYGYADPYYGGGGYGSGAIGNDIAAFGNLMGMLLIIVAIAAGSFVLHHLIMLIIFCVRQNRRKRWYRPMAAYYSQQALMQRGMLAPGMPPNYKEVAGDMSPASTPAVTPGNSSTYLVRQSHAYPPSQFTPPPPHGNFNEHRMSYSDAASGKDIRASYMGPSQPATPQACTSKDLPPPPTGPPSNLSMGYTGLAAEM